MRKFPGRRPIGAPFSLILLTVALTLAAAATTARASLQITVGNPGLEHFDTDGAVQLDFGLTDQNGQPVGNLRVENLKVLEDGAPAKILDFRGVGQGRPVDIVFVMDITESMQPYIDAIKQNIIQFVQDLAANNRDYRLGLVTFEDYVVSAYPDCNCAYRKTMTSNVQQFIQWVGGLHAGGGGDIPEDQLDALAYASTFPYRPNAQGIVIMITDAPPHVKGDGPDRSGDAAYQAHHPDPNAGVTEETAATVAAKLQNAGLTLYAVAPPPFIAPQYAQIVQSTHGRLYNIISEANRFPDLVREIGHSIATEYSLTYQTPRPVEDGTNRAVELQIDYNGAAGSADTSYQVRGVGGAAINIPAGGAAGTGPAVGEGLGAISFKWWNGAVPLIAIAALFALSRMRFGVSADELKSIVDAQSAAAPVAAGNIVSSARDYLRDRGQHAAAAQSRSAAATQVRAAPAAPIPSGEARLTTINPIDPVPSEYALFKEEVSLGRGEDNDVVIPHASVSRAHARLTRHNGAFELRDLNSTNGSFVNGQQVRGSVAVANGSEVRFGDISFILRF